MKAALQALALLLSAQSTFGTAQVRLLGLRHDDRREKVTLGHFSTDGFADRRKEVTAAAGDVGTGLAVEPTGYSAGNYDGRELQSATPVYAVLLIVGIPVEGEVEVEATIKITTSNTEEDVDVVVPVEPDPTTPGLGEGTVEIPLNDDELNEDHTDLSSDCVLTFVAHGCVSGDCEHFSPDGTTSDAEPIVVDVVTSSSGSPPVSSAPDILVGDPHMLGLRGQKIDWSGVDGGWYSLIQDNNAGININVRVTAPLPDEFPGRQLVTGFSLLVEGHSLVIEVKDPYTIHTEGCPHGVSPCLANGGLRAVVDGAEADDLIRFSRTALVADDLIVVSASNLPVECRQFGGDRIWARMYKEMSQSRRLLSENTLEDWILSFPQMAAHDWCVKYIAENDLADLQSTHGIFRIETPTLTVRLNAGVNYQGGGEVDGDGRVLPDLDFWQMDIGLDGLDVENPELSGLLGETARPVYDQAGIEVTQGWGAFRGDIEDYRVSGSLGTYFALLDKKAEGRK